jgi:hypothetical protein
MLCAAGISVALTKSKKSSSGSSLLIATDISCGLIVIDGEGEVEGSDDWGGTLKPHLGDALSDSPQRRRLFPCTTTTSHTSCTHNNLPSMSSRPLNDEEVLNEMNKMVG